MIFVSPDDNDEKSKISSFCFIWINLKFNIIIKQGDYYFHTRGST